jgi:hypothetical protein
VTFAPQSAANTSGSVAIASNASNPTLSITVSGSAITQSQGTLNVSSVNAGSVVVGTSGNHRSLPPGQVYRYLRSAWVARMLPSFLSAAFRFP